MSAHSEFSIQKLVIIGGGPGGYEAALVAASLGAEVTIIEKQGLGGSAVLTDVVPSKTLIASADAMTRFAEAADLGVHVRGSKDGNEINDLAVDLDKVNTRLLRLAATQSRDIKRGLERVGVRVIAGTGRLLSPTEVQVTTEDGLEYTLEAQAVLLAVGAYPRELPTAKPDGERIFTWKQLYHLTEVPEHMIVVGSGVTGAEFASAYRGLGAEVTLISSRDRVLPGEDEDAAVVLENVFERRGMNVVSRSRAQAVERSGDGVVVTLADGRKIAGSHCLVAVGGIPATQDLGLEEVGVAVADSGHIKVDGVSRTTVPGIYAVGDCTGVLPLASVAAMQGRIAVAHLMGDTVKPLRTHLVASNIFTSPEIASVGVSEKAIEEGTYQADTIMLKLSTNPRAKMMAVEDGFVKIFSRKGSGTVIGGVVVGPRASELIFPISMAVTHKLHVDDLADTFTIYPSLSGSISEAARRLHVHL
ncbi:NAD(P)H-quinone dehydrogenase [Kocuria sp. LUK]|uniref:NAD(P)H dehydrogenase (quinone) n=1 Tax=Kocuria flava TaxID=446860 RepID=A0A2N4T4N2_9MICC|nr:MULTISPECIES: NAD(P)H-quinone dehydrogenase [Kocuria]MCD1145015.1 NAD(P)H-quinone dehydrogenase [Kocuria sp. LUK]PLC13166.1 flavoprotein disulfide reductase [Kocuria flava]